jgi:catechol 2,3-dioxygenase-like lactoylglutathione lyase family enzyme
MSTELTMAPSVRFHLSLNVSSLNRSIEFYQILFSKEPAKKRPDYAKFELDDPPLVLSLEPSARPSGGALNHLGFRLSDSAALVAMQERLERAGIRSQREEGVECCYARQTKFWVQDPDHTLWEIYTLEGDLDHRGEGQTLESMLPDGAQISDQEPVIWEHRLDQSVPQVIPEEDNSVDEVRLSGTFNVPLPAETQRGLLAEAARVLKPGGRIFVHVLVADRSLSEPLELPGPAAVVKFAPIQSEPVRLLHDAGFQAVRMVKFDAKPCFIRHGVAMRELQLEGRKAGSDNEKPSRVLYKGPFQQLADDSGIVFRRGEWVQVSPGVATRLRSNELSEFVFSD